MATYNLSNFSQIMVIESWDMIIVIGVPAELGSINKDDILIYSPDWGGGTITWKCKVVSKKETNVNVILYAMTENLGELLGEDVDGW